MKLLLSPVVVVLVVLVGSAVMERSHGREPKAQEEGQRVKKLFEAMRSGEYVEIEFPKLDLTDVPALLEYADSTKTLKIFPRHTLSSQYEATCSEGMVALWLIEGVRQGGKYPSLNSLCFKVGVEAKDWTKASEDNHKNVVKAYRAWWDKAKFLSAEKAKALNPLKDTRLSWH
jgi:hypothetical protein